MNRKKVSTLTPEEQTGHCALMKEKQELQFTVAKYQLKERTFYDGILGKKGLPQGVVYIIQGGGPVKKRGIYIDD